jgi:hypothetical protein
MESHIAAVLIFYNDTAIDFIRKELKIEKIRRYKNLIGAPIPSEQN